MDGGIRLLALARVCDLLVWVLLDSSVFWVCVGCYNTACG